MDAYFMSNNGRVVPCLLHIHDFTPSYGLNSRTAFSLSRRPTVDRTFLEIKGGGYSEFVFAERLFQSSSYLTKMARRALRRGKRQLVLDMEGQTLKYLLDFVLRNRIPLFEFSQLNEAIHLFKAAYDYDVYELKGKLDDFIARNVNQSNCYLLMKLLESYRYSIAFQMSKNFFVCFFPDIRKDPTWTWIKNSFSTMALELLNLGLLNWPNKLGKHLYLSELESMYGKQYAKRFEKRNNNLLKDDGHEILNNKT